MIKFLAAIKSGFPIFFAGIILLSLATLAVIYRPKHHSREREKVTKVVIEKKEMIETRRFGWPQTYMYLISKDGATLEVGVSDYVTVDIGSSVTSSGWSKE